MLHRIPAAFGLLLVAGLATACSDTSDPMAANAGSTSASAQGSGSGGGGGGGGGGTGGGGGATTFSGRISPAGATATCDAGTSLGISLSKGTNTQIQVALGFVASPTVGPNGETSLGGWWMVTPLTRAQSIRSLSMYFAFAGTGFSRDAYTLGLIVLKMPPTRIGFQSMATPSSAAIGWMLWNARYVHGLEQSK